MTEDLKVQEVQEEKEKENTGYTDVTTLNDRGAGERKWYQIAEVRMVMYVVPVAIIFLIAAYILSQITH